MRRMVLAFLLVLSMAVPSCAEVDSGHPWDERWDQVLDSVLVHCEAVRKDTTLTKEQQVRIVAMMITRAGRLYEMEKLLADPSVDKAKKDSVKTLYQKLKKEKLDVFDDPCWEKEIGIK